MTVEELLAEPLDGRFRSLGVHSGLTVASVAEQGWRLAVAWYGPDRRAPEWRRKTVDEVEQVFGEIGLISPFWNLR